MYEPVHWVISADELEKKILSGEWTKLTDLEIDQFLAAPEIGEVNTSGTLPDQEEALPELAEKTEGGEIEIENVENIEEIETDSNLCNVNNDNYDYFNNWEPEVDFVLSLGPKYYTDESYNHFYVNDFTNNVFY